MDYPDNNYHNSSPDRSSSKENEYYSEHSYDEHESPIKRMKPSKVDRITNLPDALITHILSLLHIKAAVRTQLLSKRWRYAWTSSPSLIFSGRGDLQFEDVQVINNALMLHKGSLLNLTLRGIGSMRYGFESPINVWVQCAVDKKIEVLVLDIHDHECSYVFPQSLFLCDTLREFSFSNSKFDLVFSVVWKSLKKLTLKYANNLYSDKIHRIINGSPVLESLNLKKCSGFCRVIVPSDSKLRNLVINSCNQHRFNGVEYEGDKDYGELLEISGPSITNLEISGEIGSKQCSLKNVSSLVQVSLRFSMSNTFEDDVSSEVSLEARLILCRSMMMLLLIETSLVEKLSLGTWCIQVLSMCELKHLRTTYIKCKILEIDSVCENNIPGIARLLRCSPCLERFTIYMEPYRYDQEINLFPDFNGENYWKTPEKAAFMNPWKHLKVVQFIGSFSTDEMTFMVELAEYVLDHAKVLEKLVLKPSEDVYRQSRYLRHSNLYYVIQKLLSYPRCSNHARVIL